MRRCAYTRCPRLIPDGERYCSEHKRARDHERGSSTQRGYGSAHQRERAQWWQRMAAGEQDDGQPVYRIGEVLMAIRNRGKHIRSE